MVHLTIYRNNTFLDIVTSLSLGGIIEKLQRTVSAINGIESKS
jgi:hypothetical protein